MTKTQLDDLIALMEAKMRRARLEASNPRYAEIAPEVGELLEFESQKIKALQGSIDEK